MSLPNAKDALAYLVAVVNGVTLSIYGGYTLSHMYVYGTTLPDKVRFAVHDGRYDRG